MKTIIIILITACSIALLRYEQLDLTSVIHFSKNPKQTFIEVTDKNDRQISCKLISKRSDYIYIERQSDQQLFPIHLNTLSPSSRERFEDIADFNVKAINEAIYPLALKATTIELLSIPSHYYFTCPINGRTLKSCHANETEAFRNFLRKNHYHFKEVSVNVTNLSENRFQLPLGTSKLPCIRIEGIQITERDSNKVRAAIIEAYINAW